MPVISCVFAPSLETPAHIELAERLGYRRAWCYDSPALCADPWMVLALAAARTAPSASGPPRLCQACAIRWSPPRPWRRWPGWRLAG